MPVSVVNARPVFSVCMVYCYLSDSYSNLAHKQLFDAAAAALRVDAAGLDSLLLGHQVVAVDAAPLDAVVLRPHSITLLIFVPRGGLLSIPALGYGSWLLDGVPLSGLAGFDNPFEQFIQQKVALEAWLAPRLSAEQANLRFITGVVVFGAPITFGSDVEPALNSAAATGFQLLPNLAELPRRLRQLATPEIDLSVADLAADFSAASGSDKVAFHTDESALAAVFATPVAANQVHGASEIDEAEEDFDQESPRPADFLTQKARQLWGWLGAADIPDDDPPYGQESAAARSEEKQHLEHLRQQMQADLTNQLQALEAREAERERNIAQLRAELAQAPPVAAEATALVSRLGAETREKAALEVEMQASRVESAARNQELDAKIQQLSHLIERLNSQSQAPAPVVPHPATSAFATAPYAAPVTVVAEPLRTPKAMLNTQATPTGLAWSAAVVVSVRAMAIRLRQQPWPQWLQSRLALLAGVVAMVILVGWGLSHLGSSSPVPYQENGRWGFADSSGKPVIPATFTAASPFQAGRAVVVKDGAYGFLDENGKEVVPPVYDALNPYADGYARARVGDAYTFVNEKGEEFDSYYFNAFDFAEGNAAVLDHRGWYYISGPAEPAKPVIFIEAYSFVNGLARVKLVDGYTYINPSYLNDPSEDTKPFGRYQLATDFVEGRAHVTQNGRSFIIDKHGEEIK